MQIPRNPSYSDFSVSEDEEHQPNCHYFETNGQMETTEILTEPQKKEQKKKETHNISNLLLRTIVNNNENSKIWRKFS